MAHVLVLHSRQHIKWSKVMLEAAKTLLVARGHIFDEVHVPTLKEMPAMIAVLAEGKEYDAVVCVGILEPMRLERTKMHYQEVLRCLYDYSSYFGQLVAKALLLCKLEKLSEEFLEEYVTSIVGDMCDALQVIQGFESMEKIGYDGRSWHN